MMHEDSLGVEFFTMLAEIDEEIAVGVAASGCPVCGGPLHRGNYLRKPRGGRIAADQVEAIRFSLCCGQRGCRRRALPPSVRFLGRRVYWEAVVLLASVRVLVMGVVQQAPPAVIADGRRGSSIEIRDRRSPQARRPTWPRSALRLLHKRLESVRDVIVGTIEHPQSRTMDFYRELGDLFGVPLAAHNRWGGFKALRARWADHITSTLSRPVLIIDEAQEALTPVFNELRVLASKPSIPVSSSASCSPATLASSSTSAAPTCSPSAPGSVAASCSTTPSATSFSPASTTSSTPPAIPA
jgi:hypothetical protein